VSAEDYDPTIDYSQLEPKTGYFRGKKITYHLVGETAVFQGDIILDRTAIRDQANRPGEAAIRPRPWPEGIIPYTFDPSWTAATLPAARASAKRAMDAWVATGAKITFTPKTANHTNWINFVPSTGGYSSLVGVSPVDGPQDVNFPSTNILYMKVAHELGHVLGFWHEQSRQDRDTYITIDLSNVIPGVENNFDQYYPGDGTDVGKYDFQSIMHYSQYAFSNDPNVPTIVPKAGFAAQAANMGQRDRLSDGDIAAARRIYT
jgi:hypothetical protein